MIFYAIVVENWKRGHDLMQNVKLQKIAGAVILILIIVIYTFYRMHDTDAVNVSVGVDDSKIGIVEDGKNAVFIDLEDIVKVELADSYDEIDGQNYEVYADEGIGEYLIIQTTEKVYVVNTINKNTTKTMYQEIQSAVGK